MLLQQPVTPPPPLSFPRPQATCSTVPLGQQAKNHITLNFISLQLLPVGEREGGLLPYINHIGMCRPEGYGFCAVLVWKLVYSLPILVWNRAGIVSEGTTGKNVCICCFNSKWLGKKGKCVNLKGILRNCLFAFWSKEVWKRVWILEARPQLFKGWRALSIG